MFYLAQQKEHKHTHLMCVLTIPSLFFLHLVLFFGSPTKESAAFFLRVVDWWSKCSWNKCTHAGKTYWWCECVVVVVWPKKHSSCVSSHEWKAPKRRKCCVFGVYANHLLIPVSCSIYAWSHRARRNLMIFVRMLSNHVRKVLAYIVFVFTGHRCREMMCSHRYSVRGAPIQQEMVF